jgi:hypothetical protein
VKPLAVQRVWGCSACSAARRGRALRISHWPARMIDMPLLRALLGRWEMRFKTETPARENVALFRSLNMALSAAILPGNVEVTIYDIGKAIALWVSTFEILAHRLGTSQAAVRFLCVAGAAHPEPASWNALPSPFSSRRS